MKNEELTIIMSFWNHKVESESKDGNTHVKLKKQSGKL